MRIMMFALFGTAFGCTPGLAHGPGEQVSPMIYQKLTCLQIALEGRSISKKGFALAGLQAGTGGSDGSETASAIVIVWPKPSHVSDERLAKLAHADSEMDALEQASIQNQCSIQFKRFPKS
jgi:hypothetical protein